MTAKRFKISLIDNEEYEFNDYVNHEIEIGKSEKLMYIMKDKLNELHEKNKALKQENMGYVTDLHDLTEQDTKLLTLIKNQSVIIQELHSKILEYELKEPINLTKEDLELMNGAVSYYTHGRCGE